MRAGLRLLLGAGLVIGLFAVAGACGGGGGPPAGPRLVFDDDEFDLGLIGWEEAVERTVRFRNEGLEPLTVSIVKVRAAPDAACGCGVERSEVRPAAVPPGETGDLVFTLRAPESMKKVMEEMRDRMLVELQSNDPANPQRTITVIFTMGGPLGPEGGDDGS